MLFASVKVSSEVEMVENTDTRPIKVMCKGISKRNFIEMIDAARSKHMEEQELTKMGEELKTQLANAHSTILDEGTSNKKFDFECERNKVISQNYTQKLCGK